MLRFKGSPFSHCDELSALLWQALLGQATAGGQGGSLDPQLALGLASALARAHDSSATRLPDDNAALDALAAEVMAAASCACADYRRLPLQLLGLAGTALGGLASQVANGWPMDAADRLLLRRLAKQVLPAVLAATSGMRRGEALYVLESLATCDKEAAGVALQGWQAAMAGRLATGQVVLGMAQVLAARGSPLDRCAVALCDVCCVLLWSFAVCCGVL